MADRKNDRIPSTEQWKKRARDILASLDKEEAPSRPVPRIERVDPNVRMEPIVMPEKNVLTDPDSWLNRGLMSLGSNAVDAVFGEESGNPLVDYGVANVPGVGAASILAAGGMPGIVDAVGLGELKHGKKLVKSVREFILRNAGEPGLRAVDNYLDKFPKVDKLSMADADYLLTSGKLGEKFKVDYSMQTDAFRESLNNSTEALLQHEDDIIEKFGHFDPEDPKRLLWIDDEGRGPIMWSSKIRGLINQAMSALDKGDLAEAQMLSSTAAYINRGLKDKGDLFLSAGPDKTIEAVKKQVRDNLKRSVSTGQNAYGDPVYGEYLLSQLSPMQDFAKIEANQLAKDARRAAKKGTVVEVPEEPAGTLVEVPTEQGGTVVEIPTEPAPELPKGGPNKWRENGWKSEEHPLSGGLTYDELVGKGATEDDRRASFVLDSLMNEAVGRLYSTGAKWGEDGKFYKKGNVPAGVKTVEPSYADYRHKGTNYDAVRLKLARDLQENAISGNMPTTAKAVLEQAYNKRSGNRIPGARVLKLNGMDTYETLFRPRVKDRLKELEEYYNIDFMR